MQVSERQRSSLAALFPSLAMARLVVFFLVHPGGRFHVRELMRQTGLPSASLQAELRRLSALGTLRREDDGGRAFYSADEEHAAWRAWILLLRACARPADVLREALAYASGLEGACVFGSTARDDAGPDSDVDVLLVGDDDARQHAGRLLSDASVLVERDLDVIGYAPDELRARVRAGNAFIRRVLAEPTEWLRGGIETFGGAVPEPSTRGRGYTQGTPVCPDAM